jgi:hypothetical protein
VPISTTATPEALVLANEISLPVLGLITETLAPAPKAPEPGTTLMVRAAVVALVMVEDVLT